MTISVYPRYVGPTVEYRYASLYPKWLGHIIDGGIIFPPGTGEFLGGVVVLDAQTGVAAVGSKIAAMVSATEIGALTKRITTDISRETALTGVTASVIEYGVRTLGGAAGVIYATLKAGVTTITAKTDVIEKSGFGTDVRDEDPEI